MFYKKKKEDYLRIYFWVTIVLEFCLNATGSNTWKLRDKKSTHCNILIEKQSSCSDKRLIRIRVSNIGSVYN